MISLKEDEDENNEGACWRTRDLSFSLEEFHNVEEDENDDDMVDDRCFSETTSVNNGERK